jgi:hypothetical protein
MEQHTQAVKMPKKLEQYIGKVRGDMAPGDRIPVNTEMDAAQRDLQEGNIWKYAEKSKGVDWNLFGYATAVKYPGGTLKLINGQHRIELVKHFAPEVTEVPAHIVDLSHLSDDEAQKESASLFAKMNGTASRHLTSDQLFWAGTIEGDPDALFYKSVLERANLMCGRVNEGPGRKKVKYSNFIKAVKMGVDETIRAAELIDYAYPKNAMNDTLLSGMARLFSHSSYEELMDSNTKIYQQFEDWFVNILPQVMTIQDLSFRVYRNTHLWHDGVAYGLYQKFAHYQRIKGRKCMPVDAIQLNYEKGIKVDEYL